ncbi:MAG: hypothetical protein GW809_02115 [Bacteroidetes bacterium]|nr:hypothetical protein [Bacteroidota bacterium]
MKKFFFYFIILSVVLLLSSHELIAQPPGMPNAPDQAPIDGGLSFLLLSGGAYALKKLTSKK